MTSKKSAETPKAQNKTITITLGDAMDLFNPLVELGSYPFNMKPKYRLSRSLDKILSEKKRFEKQKVKIFQENGRITANGGYEIDPNDLERVALVSKMIEDLKAVEIELDIFQVLLSEITKDVNDKPIDVSSFVLATCGEFIVDDTDFLN